MSAVNQSTAYVQTTSQAQKDSIVARLKSRMYGKKMPLKTLSIGNIYVFFSKQGSLFALLMLITFITGVNYGNNLVLGFLFYVASIFLISVFVTFSHLVKLSLSLKEIYPVQVGEYVKIEVHIDNKGSTARQIHVGFAQKTLQAGNDRLSNQATDIDELDEQAYLLHQYTTFAINDEAQVGLYLKTVQRGVFEVPRLTVSTIYPFGIVRAWAYARFDKKIAVYPAPLPFDTMTYGQGGELSAMTLVKGQEEFAGLDVYKQGESLARVSWRHLASGQGMLSKQFTDPVGQAWAVDYFAMPSHLHEEKLAQLVYLLLLLKQAPQPFDFVLPSGHWQGGGEQFVHECLTRLAFEPAFSGDNSTHPTQTRQE